MTSPLPETAAPRRAFAIISHPDAGKTTLTEKLLLYAGAIETAGSVKDRRGQRSTTSDWQEIEQKRGISISSTVLRFSYRNTEINLLDTPGHKDFSEDTYRVLSAVDSAIMVIDAAKGIEAQTLKLFEVSKQRGIPLLTFVNKCDRPGPGPLGILDEIEEKIGLLPTPVNWPVGLGTDFFGVVDRRDNTLVRFTRSEHGKTAAKEKLLDMEKGLDAAQEWGKIAREELDLLHELGQDLDTETFLAGVSTPVFFGSALWNFGIQHLLDAVVDLCPAPGPRNTQNGSTRQTDDCFSGFVFKIQANMDRNHRDHMAFVRVNSGVFQRGMTIFHEPSGKPLNTKYAQQLFGQGRGTIEKALPGDVIGLVNTTDLRIGDTVHTGDKVCFPPLPTFAPEHFMVAYNRDTTRYKQFKKGISQLDREGIVQVMRHPTRGDQAPILAAVGPLQFEVALHRLENEFGAPVELSPSRYKFARQTDEASAKILREIRDVDVLEKEDGSLFAVFDSNYVLNHTRENHPELVLREILT